MSDSTNSGECGRGRGDGVGMDSSTEQDLGVSFSLLPLSNHSLSSGSGSSHHGDASIGVGKAGVGKGGGGHGVGSIGEGGEDRGVVDEGGGGSEDSGGSTKDGGLGISRSLAVVTEAVISNSHGDCVGSDFVADFGGSIHNTLDYGSMSHSSNRGEHWGSVGQSSIEEELRVSLGRGESEER